MRLDLIRYYAECVKTFLVKKKATLLFLYALFMTGFVVFNYFFRPVVVAGSSMLPTLNNDQTIFIKRLIAEEDIKKGDIIVFRSPLNRDKLLVKRVIATAGDTVAIIEGKVYVNGKLLYEPYLNGVKSHETIPMVRVPEGCYYVLGDNRVVSMDSREFGFVKVEDVYGKLVFKGEGDPFN